MRFSDWSSAVFSSDLFLETLFQPRIALGVQFGLRDLTVAVGVKLRKCLVERRGHFYFREIAITVRVCSPRAVTIGRGHRNAARSEEHTSELQSLMRISYAVFCLTKKKSQTTNTNNITTTTRHPHLPHDKHMRVHT